MTTEAPVRNTRLARFFLPDINPQSEILPDDQWIKDNARDVLKTNKTVRRAILRIVSFPLLAVAALGLGVAGTVAALPAGALAAGILFVGLTAAAFCGYKTRMAVHAFKKDALPEIRAEVLVRYLKLKGQKIAQAWKEEIEKRRVETPLPGAQPEPQATPAIKTAPSIRPKKGLGALRHIFTGAKKIKELKNADVKTPTQKPPAP